MVSRREATVEAGCAEAAAAIESVAADGLNACITAVDPGLAMAEARRGAAASSGALAGRPLAVKDNIHVSGLRCTAGTAAMRGFVPGQDAAAVARLRSAGMAVVAKTNLHELALGVTSTQGGFGTVRNAVDPSRIAGGSSGGTAALIGSGALRHGLGTDTGGSARIPAAYNDVWGFRPSTGRYETDGVTSIAFSRDTVGVMGRGIAEVRELDAALAVSGRASMGPGSRPRIGVDRADLEQCDEPVARAFEEVLRRLEASGDVELVPVVFGGFDEPVAELEPRLGAHELVPSLRRYLLDHEELPTLDELCEEVSDPHVRLLIDGSREAVRDGVWTEAWHAMLNERDRVRCAYLGLLGAAGADAVLRPTAPALPARVDDVLASDMERRTAQFGVATSLTRAATLVGAPSVSAPLGPLLGHPMTGAMLDGLPGYDAELLELAALVAAVLRG